MTITIAATHLWRSRSDARRKMANLSDGGSGIDS